MPIHHIPVEHCGSGLVEEFNLSTKIPEIALQHGRGDDRGFRSQDGERRRSVHSCFTVRQKADLGTELFGPFLAGICVPSVPVRRSGIVGPPATFVQRDLPVLRNLFPHKRYLIQPVRHRSLYGRVGILER